MVDGVSFFAYPASNLSRVKGRPIYCIKEGLCNGKSRMVCGQVFLDTKVMYTHMFQ